MESWSGFGGRETATSPGRRGGGGERGGGVRNIQAELEQTQTDLQTHKLTDKWREGEEEEGDTDRQTEHRHRETKRNRDKNREAGSDRQAGSKWAGRQLNIDERRQTDRQRGEKWEAYLLYFLETGSVFRNNRLTLDDVCMI